jgi:hypothetical protein
MSDLPGRTCPLRYRYGAQAISKAPLRQAEVLYIIGGLYGNIYALQKIQTMMADDAARGVKVTACFNGDFNWFNVSDEDFTLVNQVVAQHDAIVGNVEAELTVDDLSTGCGCAYPDSVSDLIVERSNRIFERLHLTALRHPAVRRYFSNQPMFARYQIGESKIGIVHGDYESLAGWQFDVTELQNPTAHDRFCKAFSLADVDVFASSHTCLPSLKTFASSASTHQMPKAIINNGAAGMPNFSNTHFGVITRIGLQPSTQHQIHSVQVGKLWIEALRVDFDGPAWEKHFLQSWPIGSDAYESYFERICHGPRFEPSQAYEQTKA